MNNIVVNHDSLSVEIIKSKLSYCYFSDPQYAVADIAVDDLADADAALLGHVVRVGSWDQIPKAITTNVHFRGPARDHARVNFKPFSHYLITKDGPVEVGRSHWRGDMLTGQFSADHGRLTPCLGRQIMMLVDRLGNRANFRRYSYLDEMIGDALAALCANALKYDEMQDTSAIAYLTTIATHAMVNRLTKEKAAQRVRDDLFEQTIRKPSMARQMEAELARFEPVALKRTKRRQRVYIEGEQRKPKPQPKLLTKPRPIGKQTGKVRQTNTIRLHPTTQRDAAATLNAQIAINVEATASAVRRATMNASIRIKIKAKAKVRRSEREAQKRLANEAAMKTLIIEAKSKDISTIRGISQYLCDHGYSNLGKPWSITRIARLIGPRTNADRVAHNVVTNELIAQARSEGMSMSSISDWLNQQGHRTKTGMLWSDGNLDNHLYDKARKRTSRERPPVRSG